MLNQLEKVKDQWGGESATIDNWLQARQKMLIRFCELAGISKEQSVLPEANEIGDFCNMMMDYVSSGHFGIYDMLVNDDTDGIKLKNQVYPKLADTTDQCLNFSDKYAEAVSDSQASRFDADLAALGETLEERFALEDALIGHMYSAQGDKLKAIEADDT